jgi:folate-dependent tRNA-U54 methylase TrmFO/GidA
MKANLGILPQLEGRTTSKSDRAMAYAERSTRDLDSYMKNYRNRSH